MNKSSSAASKSSRKVRFTLPPENDGFQLTTIEIDLSKILNSSPRTTAINNNYSYSSSPSSTIHSQRFQYSPIPVKRSMQPIQTRLTPTTNSQIKVDESKVHGTTRYINGVLKFCPDDYRPSSRTSSANTIPIHHQSRGRSVTPSPSPPPLPPPTLTVTSSSPSSSPLSLAFSKSLFGSKNKSASSPYQSPIRFLKPCLKNSTSSSSTMAVSSPTKCKKEKKLLPLFTSSSVTSANSTIKRKTKLVTSNFSLKKKSKKKLNLIKNFNKLQISHGDDNDAEAAGVNLTTDGSDDDQQISAIKDNQKKCDNINKKKYVDGKFKMTIPFNKMIKKSSMKKIKFSKLPKQRKLINSSVVANEKTKFRSHSVILTLPSSLAEKRIGKKQFISTRNRNCLLNKIPNQLFVPSACNWNSSLGESTAVCTTISHMNLNNRNYYEFNENYNEYNIPTTLPSPPPPQRTQSSLLEASPENHKNAEYFYKPNGQKMQQLLSEDSNLMGFLDFVERWRCTQKATKQKLLKQIQMISSSSSSLSSSSSSSSSLSSSASSIMTSSASLLSSSKLVNYFHCSGCRKYNNNICNISTSTTTTSAIVSAGSNSVYDRCCCSTEYVENENYKRRGVIVGCFNSGGNDAGGYSNTSSSNSSSVRSRKFKQSDGISINPSSTKYRTRKMDLQKAPLVTTLLRAARDADEELLRIVLRDILVNGITSKDLNSDDNSGRTALSYICSTNLIHILDIFLQIPGININKPDKEGNTPLHFAAQAGQSEAINMLLTRSRSIEIDAKNNLGFTPLMKAALQGRTKCAKLLLFAGASPVETDSGRGYRADQWSRFCGRYSCAEMIEKCARVRLLEKTTSCKWSHDTLPFDKSKVTRTKTNPGTQSEYQQQQAEHQQQQQAPLPDNSGGGGIRSKLKKVFPFNFAIKDKITSSKTDRSQNKSDLANYLNGSTKRGSVGNNDTAYNTKSSKDGSKINMKNNMKHSDVPKLEITPANNQQLIKKYETLYGEHDDIDEDDNDDELENLDAQQQQQQQQQPPIVPPRSRIRSN